MSLEKKLIKIYKSKQNDASFHSFLLNNTEKIIKTSNFFDEKFYLNQYPDIKNLKFTSPLVHYINLGLKENCKPNHYFDGVWYLEKYDDVKKELMNPLLHFAVYGKSEGRYACACDELFFNSIYLSNLQLPSILAALDEKKSIIIPVYGSFFAFKRCIDSVIEFTKEKHEIIIIDDYNVDDKFKYYFEELLTNFDNIKVIKNNMNLGFVESINLGITCNNNDIIILNSDTVVTNRWLEKMTLLAYSNPRIGTVTPFSNNAGSFSVPNMDENNTIPDDIGLEGVSNIIDKISSKTPLITPTGNGFCMYIKRDLINAIGIFDDSTFARGYCEENDFCMRANEKGWLNVIENSTYVFHERNASFKDTREELFNKNYSKLIQKYPNYPNLVKEFFSSIQLKTVQNEIKNKLINYKLEELHKYRKMIVTEFEFLPYKINMDLNDSYKNYLLNIEKDNLKICELNEEGHIFNIKSYKFKDLKNIYHVSSLNDIFCNILYDFSIDDIIIDLKSNRNLDFKLLANKFNINVLFENIEV